MKGKDLTPAILFKAEVITERVKKGLRFTQDGKFNDALGVFRSVLQSIPLSVAKDAQEERQLTDMIEMCREYVTFTRLEVARKALDPAAGTGRQIELNAYMTCCKVQQSHLLLSLRLAMSTSFKNGNYITASSFAKRIIQGNFGSPEKMKEVLGNARQLEKVCEQRASDQHQVRFDAKASVEGFKMCASSFTPIGLSDPTSQCPYCGSSYHASHKGQVCSTCQLSEIGANTLGIQLRPI